MTTGEKPDSSAPQRRRLTPEARKREILRAAARAFAQRPYDAVQISEVAEQAGASRALVSHYFGDKRGLFLAVARDIVTRAPRVAKARPEIDPVAMVNANTAAWLDMVERSRETSLLFLGLGPFGRDPELEALYDELRDRFAERILQNHLDTDEIPPAALRAMRAATGLLELAVRDWLLDKGPTREQTHIIVVESILAVVQRVIPAVLAAEGEEGD